MRTESTSDIENPWFDGADGRRLDELQAAVLDVEGDLEEAMGDGNVGEHQGGSVDIKTRGVVKEWAYAYTVK